ncbi:hypothetical protein RvY_03896 [Ramazzottius varieornatus]|uniref:Uncharacterized protein n=1 Tax=Ramazzottius varieornatus TaxID=947166 RepID=A0A1D1UPN3_RAMVA|nr:hypothetical protein RvY_03896 [Ramazzottius varieornatus]
MSNGVLKISASKNHTCYVCTGEEGTGDTDCLLYNLDLLRTTIQPCANDDNVCQSVFGKTAAGKKTVRRSCAPKTDQGGKTRCWYSNENIEVTCVCYTSTCNYPSWTNDPTYKPISSDSSYSFPSNVDYKRKADAELKRHNETSGDNKECDCHPVTQNILVLVIVLCVTTAFCIGAVHFCHYKYETKRLRYEMQELTPPTPTPPPVPPPPGPLRTISYQNPSPSAHSDLRFVSHDHNHR